MPGRDREIGREGTADIEKSTSCQDRLWATGCADAQGRVAQPGLLRRARGLEFKVLRDRGNTAAVERHTIQLGAAISLVLRSDRGGVPSSKAAARRRWSI